MNTLITFFIALVAFELFHFLVLEIFSWTKPKETHNKAGIEISYPHT